MAIDQQADRPIAMAVSVALEGGKQLGHLRFGQMLTDPVKRYIDEQVLDAMFRLQGAMILPAMADWNQRARLARRVALYWASPRATL
jgi:hypothetical protein